MANRETSVGTIHTITHELWENEQLQALPATKALVTRLHDLVALPEADDPHSHVVPEAAADSLDRDELAKLGRVLSGKNETKLKDVRDRLFEAATLIDTVLEQVAATEATAKNKTTVEVDDEGSLSIFAPVIKVDSKRHVVTGHVLVANVVDLQNDYVTPETIGKAMESYMLSFQQVGEMHTEMNPACSVVECYQATHDFVEEGQPVSVGDWVLSVKVFDEEVWKKVEAGEYTGFSIGGRARREARDVLPDDVIYLSEQAA